MNPFNFLSLFQVGASKDPAKRSQNSSYYGPGGDPSGSGKGQAQQSSAARAESPSQSSSSSSSSSTSASTPPSQDQTANSPTIEKSNKAKDAIKGLAGKGLKYPSDLFDDTSDYMMIDIYEHGPAFAGETGISGPSLGTIMFYMPNSISTGYTQGWGASTLSPGGRMAISALRQAMSGGSSEQVSSYIAKALRGAETTFAAQILSGGLNSLPGMEGANLNANSLLGMDQGIGINNTIELFWSGHGGQRTANFRILMSPRDEAETNIVRDIVKTFKIAMHPSKTGGGGAQSVGGRYITYPMSFTVKYMSGSEEHQYLNQFKPMVLEGVQVEYTPDNVYATYANTSPVATALTLTFKELKIIYADDIIDSTGAGF